MRRCRDLGGMVLLGALVVATPSCHRNSRDPLTDSNTAIKVVAIVSTTGKPAQYGQDNKDGIEVAREQFTSGGINGRPVEIVYESTDGTPDGISSLVRKYSADPTFVAVLGPTTTGEAVLASGLMPQMKDPMVLLSVGSTGDWTVDGGKFNDWTFRSTRVDSQVVPLMMREISKRFHPRRAALFYHNDDAWSMSTVPVYEQACRELGIAVVAKEALTKASTDPSAQVTRAKAAGADLLIVNTYAGPGMKIIAVARDMALTARAVGTTAFANPKAFTIGTALDGAINVDIFNPYDDTHEVHDFVNRYRSKFGRIPPAYAAYGHAGMLLLLTAMRNSKDPTDRKQVRDALGALRNVKTVLGTVSYRGKGDISPQNAAVLEIRGGTYRALVQR
jgi:branched-chain amino acid transport system substrate-binding protein